MIQQCEEVVAAIEEPVPPPENRLLPYPSWDYFFEWYTKRWYEGSVREQATQDLAASPPLESIEEQRVESVETSVVNERRSVSCWKQFCCWLESERDEEVVVSVSPPTPQQGPTENSCPQASSSNQTPHVVVEVVNEEAGNSSVISSLRSSLRKRGSFRSVATTFIRVRSLFQPNPTGDDVEEWEMGPTGSSRISVNTAVTNLEDPMELTSISPVPV